VHDRWTFSLLVSGVFSALILAVPEASSFDQKKSKTEVPEYFVMDVQEPRSLSSQARKGKKFYQANCLSCHGPSTRGSAKGPPLIGYERSNHSDEKFRDAVRKGVPQHHWKYGDMPPIKNAGEQDITNLISYVRALQEFQEKQDEEQ
jgi:mono/diheme cytochrome c family protein